MTADRVRHLLLSIAVTASSRVCMARDRLMRRPPWDDRAGVKDVRVSHHSIASGRNTLDAVLVRPEARTERASLLICHGIGETVKTWRRVQDMLAGCGVASLVFDYAGYGQSSGFFHATQAERDAIAAFYLLEQLTAPLPVAVLGLSLGSGVAVAMHARVPLDRLLLLGAFTSLRDAAACVRVPNTFQFAVPPIWDAEEGLRDCRVPVLVLHGEKDALFPHAMATKIAGFYGPACELVIVPGVTHNEPFYAPRVEYWGSIVARFLLRDQAPDNEA